jgi:predicted metal-binding membrane protein
MWMGALLRVAVRGPAKGLLLASAIGWLAMAWLLDGHELPHSHAVSLSSNTLVWLAMILAMGPLLLLREVGFVWRTSLRRLRPLTVASFLSGYVAAWLLAGIAVSLLLEWLTAGSVRIAVAVSLALLWQCSPARQRCLNACHRLPSLRVFGTAACRDSLRYGVSTGRYCAAACGPLMLVVLLANGYHLPLMGIAAVVTTVERHLPARRPAWHSGFRRREQPARSWPGLTAEP